MMVYTVDTLYDYTLHAIFGTAEAAIKFAKTMTDPTTHVTEWELDNPHVDYRDRVIVWEATHDSK